MENLPLQSAKDYILEAFFILLKTKPIDKITIIEICEKAGVSRVTFYKYFKTKTDIIETYFKASELFFKNQITDIDFSDEETLKNIATMTLKDLKNNKDKMTALIDNNMEHVYLEIINNAILNSFKAPISHEDKIIACIYSGALYNLAIMWVKNDCQESFDEIIRCLVRSLKFI